MVKINPVRNDPYLLSRRRIIALNDGFDIPTDGNNDIGFCKRPPPVNRTARVAVVGDSVLRPHDRNSAPYACSDGEDVRSECMGVNSGCAFLLQDSCYPCDVHWAEGSPQISERVLPHRTTVPDLQPRLA